MQYAKYCDFCNSISVFYLAFHNDDRYDIIITLFTIVHYFTTKEDALMKNTLRLQNILERAEFQKIQDSLAVATGLSFITVDFTGTPITSHSSCTEFCKIMREGKYSGSCERCDSRGGLEAARSQMPYVYLCHAGLVDFAIPILIDGDYLGAVLGGQVLLEDPNENFRLEQILGDSQTQLVLAHTNALTALNKIIVMSLDKITLIAEMVFLICRIMVEEARLRQSLLDLNRNSAFIHVDSCFSDQYTQIMSSFDFTQETPDDTGTELLKPAFLYIKDHISGDLSLRKVASICHISPSYFSRIFSRQNLGSYSDYINKEKTSLAKRYLALTDFSISQIANKLGYADSGYFIRVFKKNTGVTPNEFRHNSSNAKGT